MANRKGVFIGAYVPNELKESLRRRAAGEHRTLSQELTRILIEAVHGKGLLAGIIGGFLLANSLNRTEMNSLRAQLDESKTSRSTDPKNSDESTLSGDEIKTKIAEADKNPGNLSFQKDLGIALYRYSAMKQD